MSISNLTGKHLKSVIQSVVFDHLLEFNCSIDFDHFDILTPDKNKLRLLIKENLLIKRDQPQLNQNHQVIYIEIPFHFYLTETFVDRFP